MFPRCFHWVFGLLFAIFWLAGCTRSIPTRHSQDGEESGNSAFPTNPSPTAIPNMQLTRPENISTAEINIEETSSDWSLERAGYQDQDLIILVFHSNQAVQSGYEGDLSGIEFTCTTQEQKPDNLYCFGDKPDVTEPWLFRLINRVSDEVEFQIEITEDIFISQP